VAAGRRHGCELQVHNFLHCWLERPTRAFHFGTMTGHRDSPPCQMKDRFRLQFQQGLREYLAQHSCAAEGFGVVWERTLEQVPLEEAAQADIYWELIQ
jgi:hypothetical protein